MKKVILAVIPALLIVIILGYFSLTRPAKKHFSPAVDAIPQDVSFFIETQNFTSFISKLSKNKIWIDFLKTYGFNHIKFYYKNAVLLLENYPKIKTLIEQNKVTIAVRRQGKNKVNFLIIISFNSNKDVRKFNHAIAHALFQNRIKPQTLQYNDKTVYSFKTKDVTYYFTFVNGLFIFSPSYLFLQNSLRQIASTSSLNTIPEFNQIAQNAGQKGSTSLYINFKNFKYAFINQLSSFGMSQFSHFENFASWTTFDLQISDDYIRLPGYTSVDEKLTKFLRIFDRVEPAKVYVDKILPSNTYEFQTFSFDDYVKFYQNYQKYLTAKDLNTNIQIKLKQIKAKYGIALDLQIYKAIGKSITLAKSKQNLASQQIYKYMIINLKSVGSMRDIIKKLITSYAAKKNLPAKSFTVVYPGTNIRIYKLPDSSLFSTLYGQLANFPFQKYAFFIDNYLVLTSNKKAISNFIKSYTTKDFLFERQDYKKFRENLTPRSNIIFYVHKPFENTKIKYFLTPQTQKLLNSNSEFFNAIENFAAEFYYFDKVFISYALFNYNPQVAHTKVIWTKKLLSQAANKPFIFINHNTGEKEIFLSDQAGNVYLINRNGQLLWTKNIGQPIAGNIYMIDYYQNHKYQLLFNTKDKIYILDRLGNNVATFPITPPAEISTSISVFDYENDGNYRIFVPCKNNRVYLYNKKGQINPQWLITQTTAPLTTPVQHFLYKGKDYIVFADDIHTYILNRRGETRINVKKNFPKASNTKYFLIPQDSKHRKPMFVTTTKSGKLAFIDFDGNVYLVKIPGNFSNSHYFTLRDLDADGNYEFIYAQDDQIVIFQEKDGKVVPYKTLKVQGKINKPLVLYNFGKGKIKIGFVTDQNKIYLIDKQTRLYPGFPKSGSTQFTITQLIKSSNFNVLVGNGQFLLNYKL